MGLALSTGGGCHRDGGRAHEVASASAEPGEATRAVAGASPVESADRERSDEPSRALPPRRAPLADETELRALRGDAIEGTATQGTVTQGTVTQGTVTPTSAAGGGSRDPEGESAAAQWIAAAQAAQRAADQGESAAAWRALEGFLARRVPDGVEPAHRRVLRQDARYRLGRLALDAGDAEAAVEQAERGLAEGRTLDLFSANLLTLRGQAYEALGEMDRAAADYYAALRVNEVLLGRALEE